MPVTSYYGVGGRIYGEQVSGSACRDYLLDALGSAIGTATSAGAAENAYRYKPYGAPLSRSGAAADPAFLWVESLGYRQTGSRYADAYVRARHYGSAQAAWIMRDPLWRQGSPNLYGYANASPVFGTDPSGLIVITGFSGGDLTWNLHPKCFGNERPHAA